MPESEASQIQTQMHLTSTQGFSVRTHFAAGIKDQHLIRIPLALP